jgi:hypothetical protein
MWGGSLSDVTRCSKLILPLASVLLIFPYLMHSTAVAQEISASTTHDNTLPEAPQPSQSANPSATNDPPQASAGTISGTVLDRNGDVVQGAKVTLLNPSGSALGTMESGSDGQFLFPGLAANTYQLTITARGMSTFRSSQISLHPEEAYIVPTITLAVSGGTTTVTVNGNKAELSRQQAEIALQQRVIGVFPNFYSTYDWNAPPMLAKQKFRVGIRSIIDPVSFLSVAGVAGAEQYQNVFPAYGSGFEGYGKRYGAALANHVSATLLGRAVYPSIFHQDPRYFYKGTGSVKSRAFYAVSAAFMARGDDGHWKPNYSRLLGNFSSAALSNLYYPKADRGGSLVVLNGLATTGGDVIANLTREFILKRFTSHIPQSENGEP